MKCILGVDGGGTKTKVAAVDERGEQLASRIGGSLNHYLVGMDGAVRNLVETARSLGIEAADIEAVSIGNPAMDDLTDHNTPQIFCDKLKESGVFSPSTAYFMKSDAFMTLYGLTQGQSGALIIRGPGSLGIALAADASLRVVGGWGAPTNDDGSGADIAARALHAVFLAADGVGPKTALTAEALAFYGVNIPRELIGVLNSDRCGKSGIAAFFPRVAACAQDGDPIAAGLLGDAADMLAAYAAALLRAIGTKEGDAARVGYYGGVFMHCAVVREGFAQRVMRICPNAVVSAPELPPELAAAAYARRMLRGAEGRK